ncbi:uncharacterized protein ACIBXB_001815 isoform 2-T2 [Morphnus guianensis]
MAAKRPPGRPLCRPWLRHGQPASPGSASHTPAALCVRRRPTAPDRSEPVPAAPEPPEGRRAREGARRGLWRAAAEGQGHPWGTPHRSLGVTHARARTPVGDTLPQPGGHTRGSTFPPHRGPTACRNTRWGRDTPERCGAAEKTRTKLHHMGKKIVACNVGTENIPQFPDLENDDKGGQWGLPASAGEWQRRGVSSDFSIRKPPLDETGCDPGIDREAALPRDCGSLI